MRSMITLLAVCLLICSSATTQAEDTVPSDLMLTQLGVDGFEQISDAEGDAIRGAAISVPTLSLTLENLVLVDLSLSRSTTVFIQNETALDLSVLVANRLNLAIGGNGN